MSHYLLLGAGFSHNWGGWLASEAFEYLIGHSAIIASTELRTLLWKHHDKGGFEGALDELQRHAARDPQTFTLQLRALESGVQQMFEVMNGAFKNRGLEFRTGGFSNDQPVRNFLVRFKAIFTLNQDLLLEHCYRGTADGLVDIRNVKTMRDWQFPGMQLESTPTSDTEVVYPLATGTWIPSDDRTVATDLQPIYKLHGSSNWRGASNDSLMILGGGKAQAIERFPVLRWYSEVFTAALTAPDARLMIIGYSFRDPHINSVLQGAMSKGLQVFVIDPNGAGAAAATNSVPKNAIGYRPTPFEELLRTALIGASRRPLASTFATDDVAMGKLLRFFGE